MLPRKVFAIAAYGSLLAISDRPEQLSNVKAALVKNMSLLKAQYQTMIIDTNEQMLAQQGNQINAYISETEGITQVKNDFIAEIHNRLEIGNKAPQWLILIADLRDFCSRANINVEELGLLISNGPKAGIYFIIASEYSYVGQSYEEIPKYVREHIRVGLVSMRLSDQDVFKQRFISNERYPDAYECYYAQDHQYMKLKLPK